MKADLSRATFDPTRHYSRVLKQQGRVDLDADWNEQADILLHRTEVEAEDVIGASGAPIFDAGFRIFVNLADLTTFEASLAGNTPPLPALNNTGGSDFYISAGRYYVDGILCENEKATTYKAQPDLKEPANFDGSVNPYLVYLDVWQRHLTALDVPSIREIALGGPDTATRTKTVWQVKWWRPGTPGTTSCESLFESFMHDLPQPGALAARAELPTGTNDPCIIPSQAGYRGLENQLYRVEVHDTGAAFDVSTQALIAIVAQPAAGQWTLASGTWAVGDFIEVFRTAADANDHPMGGIAAEVVSVAADGVTVTLNQDLSGLDLTAAPKVRRVATGAKGTFKWSRDNGIVVSLIEKINGAKVTVEDIGRDSVRCFAAGQWVEISDDKTELSGKPGQLARVVAVDPTSHVIELSVPATPLAGTTDGVNHDWHPKLRRWDGIGLIKRHPPSPHVDWIDLEEGVQVQFATGTGVKYETGDYWLIPARTAVSEADSGNVEWLVEGGVAKQMPPTGIFHNYAPLGVVTLSATGSVTRIDDCRNIFPPLTKTESLFYVSGDGQEAAPDPASPGAFFELPTPIAVGAAMGRFPIAGAKVRFQLTAGTGNGTITGTGTEVTGTNGIAWVKWTLDPVVEQGQELVASLIDDAGQTYGIPIRFHATLSKANRVAFTAPADCEALQGATTVQAALEKLCHAGHAAEECCIVVPPEEQEGEHLQDVLLRLHEEEQSWVCVCLLPGEHHLKEIPPFASLTISGRRGRGESRVGTSWILLPEQVVAGGLGSLALNDLEILAEGEESFLRVKDVERLTIHGCLIQRVKAPAHAVALLLEEVSQVSIIDSEIACKPTTGDRLAIRIVENESSWLDRNVIRGHIDFRGLHTLAVSSNVFKTPGEEIGRVIADFSTFVGNIADAKKDQRIPVHGLETDAANIRITFPPS